MKKIFTIAVFGMVLGAHAANPIDGSYNTSLGWIAGLNANGEKATAVGAAAAAEATGITRTDFVGAGAGSYSDGLTDCVGIGFRSLAFGTNMNSVVGIGRDAFLGRKGLSKATWLNGQFVAYGQNNSILRKGNPNIADTNAPIRYADGVLTLQADRIVVKGETTDGEGFAGLESPLTGYDLYVDPVNGDDSFVGTSSTTAKRTIDGAYAAVTNHDMTICLLPGEYASPGGAGSDGNTYPPYRVHYIGAYGKERTIIDGGEVRLLFGCSYGFTSVQGCTLRNMRGRVNRPRFFALYLYDCAVDISGGSQGYGFASCVIEKCTITGTANFATDNSRLFSAFFEESDVWDSVVDITSSEDINHAPSLFYASYLENVFVSVGGVVRNLGAASDPYKSVLGNSLGLKDCTVICSQAANSFIAPPSIGCLYGLGDGATYTTTTGSVCTNVAAVLESIQSDYRPSVKDWRFRFAGYNSAADRSVRNSMENSILSALTVNETLALPAAAKMSLLSMIEENEAVEAPQTVNRGTNSIPAGTVLQLPPDPEE